MMSCELCDAINEDYRVVMKDEHSFAMIILHPQTELHCLVLPRRHVTKLSDLTPQEAHSTNQMIDALRDKIDKVLDCSCITISNGRTGISQKHLHYHIIPLENNIGFRDLFSKYKDVPIYPESTWEERKKIADKIRQS